ncbi:hypothetical protein I79_020495 [Cricetulus griseus]|uniref:Uncharacterized protein n=1 Tax=Cricetulus griseus TaxID=10029 RepID=G3IA78_CRIGR|nr:hypothetical protein I79_020495 [Cricetulus griseus]
MHTTFRLLVGAISVLPTVAQGMEGWPWGMRTPVDTGPRSLVPIIPTLLYTQFRDDLTRH